MSVSTHQGMTTYNRIIQDCRAEGKPIGPKHHLHDKQLRVWVAKQKNKDQLAKARDAKKTHAAVREVRKSIQAAKQKIQARSEEITAEAALREKAAEQARQKIAEGYKTPSWDTTTGKIKSVGNGL